MADFPSNDLLSIQTSPIPLHSSSDSSDSEDDPPIPQSIHGKLTYAFVNLKVDDYKWLIQFWKPVNINGRCLLTTSDQPFIFGPNDEGLKKYRSCCEKYKYNIDVNYKVQVEVEEEDPTILTAGPPATAFLNQLPEFPRNLNDQETSSSTSSPLQCGILYSFVVPVFYPSLSSCVGVVEYWGWWETKLVKRFIDLNIALQNVGFKMFDARRCLPYNTICGLQHAKDEIDDALKILGTLSLDFSQIWIAYENEYQVAVSSSLQDTQRKQMIWLKLTSRNYIRLYNKNPEWDKNLGYYGASCYRAPMKMEQVFSGKTLRNYETLFIQDTFKLNGDEPQRLLSSGYSSCFLICLRSTKTDELDFVFEFLWNRTRVNDIIFELLLLILKRCLPSFKFASGAELGDELRILDAQASTESETKYIKIFHPNQLSSVFVTPKRGRRPEDEECLMPLKTKCKTTKKEISLAQIKSQFGKTQKEVAQNLNVSLSTLKRYCKVLGISEWPGKDYSKEKVNYLCKNTQGNSNEEEEDNGGAIQDSLANIQETSLGENRLTIKAEYADDTIKFTLPISSATFAAVEKGISEEFKLNPNDFKVKYRDEVGDWIFLSSDKAMSECIRNHRNFNITPINMKVLPRKI